jgi:hypothetical protein
MIVGIAASVLEESSPEKGKGTLGTMNPISMAFRKFLVLGNLQGLMPPCRNLCAGKQGLCIQHGNVNGSIQERQAAHHVSIPLIDILPH